MSSFNLLVGAQPGSCSSYNHHNADVRSVPLVSTSYTDAHRALASHKPFLFASLYASQKSHNDISWLLLPNCLTYPWKDMSLASSQPHSSPSSALPEPHTQASHDPYPDFTRTSSPEKSYWDLEDIVPPAHEHRTLVLCFDGTGVYQSNAMHVEYLQIPFNQVTSSTVT